MSFFKALVVSGGQDSVKVEIVLNSDSIIGINNGRILLHRHILEEIGMAIFNDARKVSHIEVIPSVVESLLGNK